MSKEEGKPKPKGIFTCKATWQQGFSKKGVREVSIGCKELQGLRLVEHLKSVITTDWKVVLTYHHALAIPNTVNNQILFPKEIFFKDFIYVIERERERACNE